MKSDEDQIRELVATWMTASRAGNVDTVLNLMTDDAVFLTPGREPMYKADFAAAAKAQANGQAPKFDGSSDIQEICVFGDWAYMWSKLHVVVMPPGGATAMERAGHTLTILRREQGQWRLARDANMLAPLNQHRS